MTALGAVRRLLACSLAVLALGGGVTGCMTVTGRHTGAHRPGYSAGHVPSDESLGVRTPFRRCRRSPGPVPVGSTSADAAADIARALAGPARRRPCCSTSALLVRGLQAMSQLVQTPGVHQVLTRNYHTVRGRGPLRPQHGAGRALCPGGHQRHPGAGRALPDGACSRATTRAASPTPATSARTSSPTP
ncbi:hypothetical protein GXW82_34810 [Streptacidiphilus sp. 4-A2]|nr:hypothetical protein [Streptacidiphilus sp. 4-A2]